MNSMGSIYNLLKQVNSIKVEFVPLWSVTIWDKRFKGIDKSKQEKVISYPYLLADDLFALQQEEGDVFLLSTGEKTGWTTETLAGSNVCSGEVVAIPWGKSRPLSEVIKYYKGRFVTADNRIATSKDTNILRNKFLFYWMSAQGKQIDRYYRGDGLQHPSMRAVLDMRIPLPPVSLQDEIILFLDTYSEQNSSLVSVLEKELLARQIQYEYYAKRLFTIYGRYETKKLRDFVRVKMCKRIKKEQTTPEGDIPFYKNGTLGKTADAFIPNELYLEYKEKYNYPKVGDVMLSTAGTVGRTIQFDGKPSYFQDSNVVWLENDETVLSNEYLYWFCASFPWKPPSRATIKHLHNDMILDTDIVAPPAEDQNKIVTSYKSLANVHNQLITAIEKEVQERQVQYDYYRNALLDFAEKTDEGSLSV